MAALVGNKIIKVTGCWCWSGMEGGGGPLWVFLGFGLFFGGDVQGIFSNGNVISGKRVKLEQLTYLVRGMY